MKALLWMLVLVSSLSLAQSQFSLSYQDQNIVAQAQPSTQLPRPSWDRLLFGPAPEGYRGLAISTRLLTWSIPWTLVGSTAGLLTDDPWQRSFWLTNSVWAAVNSGIALVGLLGAEPDQNQLRDLLYVNAAIDVGYIAAGTFLLLQNDPRAQGAGWAVLIQGAWLLVFDLFNGLALE